MASEIYTFSVEYSGDRRALHDYFYEACKCTHSSAQGSSETGGQMHYAMHNAYNLISLREISADMSAHHKADIRVTFTFNKGADVRFWSAEVLDACVRWLARSTGDAFLDRAGGPILGRSGGALVRIQES